VPTFVFAPERRPHTPAHAAAGATGGGGGGGGTRRYVCQSVALGWSMTVREVSQIEIGPAGATCDGRR